MSRNLVILLAFLQLVTPLVHAHTGEQEPHEGLHLPELEFFNAANQKPVLKGVLSHFQSNGMIIDVCTGLKFNNISFESSEYGFIARSEQFFPGRVLFKVINFSPQRPKSVRQIIHRPNSPRAPPV